jgi:hypothetical protein
VSDARALCVLFARKDWGWPGGGLFKLEMVRGNINKCNCCKKKIVNSY